MCFSASASFGSAVVLSIIGVASVRKAATPSQFAFGSFPFIFAAQQFSEGFVWLRLTNPLYADLQMLPAYAFLIFSHIIWPLLIPFSILMLENEKKRKDILRLLFGAGIVLALYHAYCLIFLAVKVKVDHHHIQYLIDHPTVLLLPANIFYGLATLLPAFISSVRRMWWLGFFILASLIATSLIYQAYIISVWCFFAAFLSVNVYIILKGLKRGSPFASKWGDSMSVSS